MNKKVIEEYAKRGAQCDVMKALTLLTQAYISQCGISLGLRTVIYCAAEPWQERLAWLDLPLSAMARKEPFVHLMPHITSEYAPDEYDDYDITAIENDELLRICLQEIKNKEFDETTLEVICWGILKATEDEQWLSEEIEAIAPDGTMLKGVLERQNCGGTWMTMSSPYNDLSILKHELVRNPRELLLAGYNDYHRLRQMESEIRALYPVYLNRISKLEKDSAWARHCVYRDVYGKLFEGMVLLEKSLMKEWWGLEIE
jgi:hypothetical protein